MANVNLFTKVAIGEDGELSYVAGHSPPGSMVTLRYELDTLVVLTATPHPLDPSPEWPARPVRLRLETVASAGRRDPVRCACPENERGFAATEASQL